MTILGTVLSRLATDLQLWNTAEFGFLTFPDSLVGSSSMMPQKRNPYLLEHIQGQSAKPLGTFVAAATAMHAKPFSNNIAANAEATSGLWDAIATITSSVVLTRLVVMGAVPQPDRMLRRAEVSFVEATEIANRLVRAGLSFRHAHEMVGSAITSALESGESVTRDTLLSRLAQQVPEWDTSALDPNSVMLVSSFGGGPGKVRTANGLNDEIATFRRQTTALSECVARWKTASLGLDVEVARICASAPSGDSVATALPPGLPRSL